MAGKEDRVFSAPGRRARRRRRRFALNLAKGVVERSGGRYEVELVSVSRRAGVPDGRARRVGPPAARRRAGPKTPLDAVSWEIPEAFADADLVHLHQAYTRGAEVGLLVAKQQRKPVCVTDHGAVDEPAGQAARLLDLVDRVIAYSDFGASLYRTSAPVTVVKGGVDATWFTPSRDARRARPGPLRRPAPAAARGSTV